MTEIRNEDRAADDARDAIAFALAYQRDDAAAMKVIFDNADPFGLPLMLADYLVTIIKVGSSGHVEEILSRLQSAQQQRQT